MEDVSVPMAFVFIFVGLPWVIMHYITRWKTAATLTTGDETLLEELYQLARRLDERMDTVERLVAADNPDFQATRVLPNRETDNQQLREIESLRGAGRTKITSGRTAQ